MTPIRQLGPSPTVVWVDGTREAPWFELEAFGRCAVVCIDAREGSPTQYRLFEGARRPQRPDAILIELGSEEEGAAISALSRYLDSDQARQTLRPEAIDWLLGLLLRHGEPA